MRLHLLRYTSPSTSIRARMSGRCPTSSELIYIYIYIWVHPNIYIYIYIGLGLRVTPYRITPDNRC